MLNIVVLGLRIPFIIDVSMVNAFQVLMMSYADPEIANRIFRHT